MKKYKIIYGIITILFIIFCFIILKNTDLSNNVALSKSIQIIIILYLIRIAYGCVLYIRKQYQKKKYSYGIIMYLGLFIFLVINTLRNINLLMENWNVLNVSDIYNNTLESFSFFAMLTLPCIIILSIYCMISNIVLIKREGFHHQNLLGIVLGLISLVGIFGTQTIYIITSNMLKGEEAIIIKKFIDLILNVVLSYIYTLIIATIYCNVKAGKHIPNYNKDYIIILGCMIKKDGSLTPLLKARVDRAIEFAKLQKEKTGKDIIFIPSGGKGDDEVMTEAEAMKNYLIEQGISHNSIVLESESTSTLENLKNSYNIIIKCNDEAQISFATTNYHVFRSGVIANNFGIDCEGIGSKTKWYFYINALMRELMANIINEKKRHISLIIFINIWAFIFIIIGYYYKLINI